MTHRCHVQKSVRTWGNAPLGLLAFVVAVFAPSTNAGPLLVTVSPPSDDVWVYTFGQGAFSTIAPTFAGVFGDPDPDRFGYYFLSFPTATEFDSSGRPARVVSFSLEVTMLNSSSFDQTNGVLYDPTYDTFETYLNPALDADPGRPIELYAVGYQNGFASVANWRAANFPVSGPDGYSAVPLDFPPGFQHGRDVSYSISDGFDTHPLAIGTTDDFAVGSDGVPRVLDLARWSFHVDTVIGGLDLYLRQSLEQGEIALILSSLQLAGFDGMGGTEVYPRFATLETFFPVQAASLSLAIEISPPADVNADFKVDIEDLYAWEQGSGLRDVNGDGLINATDRRALIESIRSLELSDIHP